MMMNCGLEDREAKPRVTFKDSLEENAEVGTNEMDALDTLNSMIDLSLDEVSTPRPASTEQVQIGYIGPGINSDQSEDVIVTTCSSAARPYPGGSSSTNSGKEIMARETRFGRPTSGLALEDHGGIQYEGSVSLNEPRVSNTNNYLAHSISRQMTSTRLRHPADIRLINGVSQHSGEETWQITWKTGVPLISAYMAGVTSFIAFFHMQDGLLPRLKYPFIGNLLDWKQNVTPLVWWGNGAVLVLLLWCIAYARRFLHIVLSLALVKPYRPVGEKSVGQTTCTIITCVVMITYHLIMGAWLGWASNIYLGYMISDLQYAATGFVLMAAAEITCVIMTVLTLKRRKQRSLRYKITKNILDFISWLGFALVSLTLPAFVHLLVRIIIVFILLKSDQARPSCC